jgi:hypothetical protein
MATIINKTYFINDLKLPIDEIGDFDSQLEKYEREILIKCLGIVLYKDFINGLNQQSIDQKWIDLRDGKDYVNQNVNVSWIGFANADKESLIAYYVYFRILYYGDNTVTSVGNRVIQTENSKVTDSIKEQVDAYNRCQELRGKENDDIENNTLYNFIKYSNDIDPNTYPNWAPEKIDKNDIDKIDRANILNI